jgi:hypothetical protein
VLLTRSPLEYPQKGLSARLACVKHAASVRPEPGSNSPSKTSTENKTQAKKRKTSNRQNHRSSTQKEPPPQPNKQAMTRRIHTNQFIDKHTVEFSKIRRAPERPSLEVTRGQPVKTYRSSARGVKSNRPSSCRLASPPQGRTTACCDGVQATRSGAVPPTRAPGNSGPHATGSGSPVR